LGVNYEVKVDVIVNDVFAEELEKTPGAVGAPEFCAIKIQHSLARELVFVGKRDDDRERYLFTDAKARENLTENILDIGGANDATDGIESGAEIDGRELRRLL